MDAVFFDMDDTLYPQSQPFVRAFDEVFGNDPTVMGAGIDAEELFKASRRYSDAMFAASERGEISMEDLYARRIMLAFEDFGIAISREEALTFQDVYGHNEEYEISLSGTMRAILDLAAARSLAGLITNGPYEHQMRKVLTLGLGAWIPKELTFVSGGLDVSKPQPEIFLLACKAAESIPERCLYVGDSFAYDVCGPASADMPCVWFNHRRHHQPPTPTPTWVVRSEQELLELLDRLL